MRRKTMFMKNTRKNNPVSKKTQIVCQLMVFYTNLTFLDEGYVFAV